MIDISEQHHTHDKKKELFVSNTGDKGILKKSINSTISTISSKTKMPTKNVRFDENLESFNNFDLGSVYNNANNANNANNVEDNIVSNVVNNDLNDKKIKDDLYEFVFNKQAEFGDSSIDSYSIQGGTKIIDGSGGSIGSIGGIGGIGIGESFGQDSIKEFNDSFIDKKSDEMFDGIIGYRESGNFSII